MYKNILILPDGTELRSGVNAKNAIRSVKLTEMVNSGKELMIGSCCCDMLEASLFAPGGTLEITAGDEVALWKESPDGQRIKMGVYTVEAPTHPTANTMKLVGYDHTAKLDKDLTAWLNSLTQWPYSINAFASMVCEACGLSFVPGNGLPNEDFQIPKWSRSGATGRQIMRWLGEITCRYIHADPDGNIRFGWYKDSGKTFTPKGSTYYFAGSFSYDNYEVTPVDIVQLRLADSESSAVWPAGKDGDNAYIITGNPILTANVTDALLHVLEAICNELSAVSYTPCTVSGVSDPLIGAGSIIHITDKNGHQVAAYVMEKESAGQKDTYTCTGSHRRDSASAQNNKPPSVKNAENAMNAADQLTQKDIFNRLTNNGQEQGIFLHNGKVYINLEYLMAGSFTSKAEAFLNPGEEEFEKIKKHLLGEELIPEEDLLKYDFNSDGNVTLSDMLLCRSVILGMDTLKEWPGAQKTEVTVTIDPSNTEKVVCIRGTNMWGRNVELFMGMDGADIGTHRGGLAIGGKLTVGKAITFETNSNDEATMAIGTTGTPKTLSWKDNGDGTYTLIGK